MEAERKAVVRAQDINPQLVARLSQRLFFVVNKVDLVHTSEGLDHAEIREYVAQLITTQMATEGFQLHPDQARTAPGCQRVSQGCCRHLQSCCSLAVHVPVVHLVRRRHYSRHSWVSAIVA